MPIAINGGGAGGPPTAQAAAYAAALAVSPGNQNASEQAVIAAFEGTILELAGGWDDSGGTGGRQAAVALEVAAFIGNLEAARLASVNQWAKEAAKGSRKAQAEMHGADSLAIAEIVRLLYELRERLNDSPY